MRKTFHQEPSPSMCRSSRRCAASPLSEACAGTAFIDTVSITKANVKVLEDGDNWLIYNRKKTGTLARVKLLPEALELISVFNFCGSMLPGVADFNAKNNKKNLHDCNEYMNNDELRNTLKFSQLSRYANKQATTKLPRYTQSVAWLHSVHLLCTRQSVNGANRDHYTNNLNNVSYGKNKRCRIVLTVSSASLEGGA